MILTATKLFYFFYCELFSIMSADSKTLPVEVKQLYVPPLQEAADRKLRHIIFISSIKLYSKYHLLFTK